MKVLFVVLALLSSLTVSNAHPNHTCHNHGTAQHCK